MRTAVYRRNRGSIATLIFDKASLMQAFPIDPYIPAIAAALQNAPFVLLKAEPGAGKTTRVPEALLASFQKILVVQPRRLAARLAAEWVAQSSGEPLGTKVGYQIRLDNKSTPATRLLFVTEGVLTRKLMQDRELKDFDLVVLDEFHERHIHTDLALALLKKLHDERPRLRVLVMSATIDLSQLTQYLGDIPTFDVPGRTFPVALEYRPLPSKVSLEEQVAQAIGAMLDDERAAGNILVFLSGLSEILNCRDLLSRRFGSSIDIVLLTAEMSGEVNRLYTKDSRRKVILSTNVAETSVTLPDVRGVIDTGWAKISGYAPWSGLPTLERQRISQASAIQRAGRAGRVAPGLCYRLYSAVDFQGRQAFTEPEIKRIDLAQTLLEIQTIFPNLPFAWRHLPWFEAPEDSNLERQKELLEHLGALSETGTLTEKGRRLSEWPLHPRLGRIVVEGEEAGQGGLTLMAALLIHEGMLLRRDELPRSYGLCDVSHQLQLLLENGRDIDRHKSQRLKQLYETQRRRLRSSVPWQDLKLDEALVRRAIFMAFADRVAKYRPLATQGPRVRRLYNFCQGRGGTLSEVSIVREAEWIVALEARETLGDESGQRCHIEVASAVDLALLEKDPFHLLSEESEVGIEEKTGRARKFLRTLYGKLVVSEKVESAVAGELSDLLLATVKERWAEFMPRAEALHIYHRKCGLLSQHKIAHKLPVFEGEYLELLQLHLCEGVRSVGEAFDKNLGQAISDQLDYDDLQQLGQCCPDAIKLDNGRRLAVHYEGEGAPWIEAKIQEFFGQADTPSICLGRQKLLVKLLAPNRRPAQLTQDLKGFWKGSYHEVKKELKRRYPKHPWPDDPENHLPPPPRPPRP